MALCNNATLSLLNKKTVFKYLIFLKFNTILFILFILLFIYFEYLLFLLILYTMINAEILTPQDPNLSILEANI